MYINMETVETVNATADAVNASVWRNIPRRLPVNSLELPKVIGREKNYISPPDWSHYYNEADLYFYSVVTVISLVFLVALILLYACCCVWVLKGNLDLPTPGGYPKRRFIICIRNPFPSIPQLFTRYNIDKTAIDNQPAPTPTIDNTMTSSEREGITTISHNTDPKENRRSIIFEGKYMGLCATFKQFQQFQYDVHDNEQEDIVFDVLDIPK